MSRSIALRDQRDEISRWIGTSTDIDDLTLADLLRREGYECQTVRDGLSAAAELNTGQQYDLLIADIRMPGNPDLELIRHLPQISDGLPAILITAYPTAERLC